MKLDQVRALDADDPLGPLRERFDLPPELVYLDGNSLGALPRSVPGRLEAAVREAWGRELITSWNTHGWIDLPRQVGEKIAPLLGAAPEQVVACDSISVNLFKLLSCAVSLRPGRTRLLSQTDNFPTDLYVAEGFAGLTDVELTTVDADAIEDAIDETVAAVFLTHVNFRSGRVHDMARITRRAHAAGALVIWDLAHSAGAMPLDLDGCNVDFAVGCGYKYLNGGPGAPAFVYVAARHQESARQPLSGWMGHAEPFAFEPRYTPGAGLQRFLSGTPPVLSMLALDEALNVFANVDLHAVHAKALALGQLLETLIEADPALSNLRAAHPADVAARGSQLAFRHPQAYQLCQALIERGIITDFRAPDLLRIGFTPLYTRYEDVWRLASDLADILRTGAHLAPRFAERARVT